MAIQDINVTSLRNAINACLESLDCSYSTEIASSLASDSIWSGGAKANLKQALETLSETRYEELKNKLNSYLSVADSIENYQSVYSEIESLNEQVKYKQNKLYVEDYKTNPDKNVKNSLTNDINSLRSDISSKRSELERIESSIVIE